MSAKEVTSFGSISERELVIVSAVADVLQPEESGKSGVSLSLESGRRVWRMRKSGVVFRFRGDYAEGSGSCVIPTRMLDEARHIVAVNPQAELTLRDGVVSVGFGAHRVSMTAGSDLEEETDAGEFKVTARVPLASVFYSLMTTTQHPTMADDTEWQSFPRVMKVVIDGQSLSFSMDWRPHALESFSQVPAATIGGNWRTSVWLGSMELVNRVLYSLRDTNLDAIPTDVLFELCDPDDDWVRIEGGDVEILVAHVPHGVEAALPEIRKKLASSLVVDTYLVDRTTIELEYKGEPVSCEVFEGDDHRARFLAPIMKLPEDWKKSEVVVLREINGHNEAHLGSFAFIDDDHVYAAHVHVLNRDSVALTPRVVTALVAEIATLRDNLYYALLIAGHTE